MLRIRLARLSVLLLAFVICGCGGADTPDRPQPVPASGQILLGNKPLAGATVTFLALDGQVSCRGLTDDQGEFVLSTYDPNDGAPAGKYKVVISIDEFEITPEGKPVPKAVKRSGPPVPGKYSRPADTPLSAEITPTGPNQFRFPLN